MNILPLRRICAAFALSLPLLLPSGCVVTDGGYGYVYSDGLGIRLDYYEPHGYFPRGGWGPGYWVAPFRGSHRGADHPGGYRSPRAFRHAPLSRPVPSIPSHPRGRPSR